MANPEHLAILRQGMNVWNNWRQQYPLVVPDLSGASLRRADLLLFDLRGSDLCNTNLTGATLINADLSEANLFGADLLSANLYKTTLCFADLHDACIANTDLRGVDLYGATLHGSDLRGANLSSARLTKSDLTGAVVGWTIFTNLDLREVYGLSSVRHQGPSSIGIDTIYRSQGKIPTNFLRNAGVPKATIEHISSLSISSKEYHSCFISYASADSDCAERIYADLQVAGVQCWFAPEDLKIGDSIFSMIDQGIQLHDKLLLILSASSIASRWVEREVRAAQARELREGRQVLFPICIDDAVYQPGQRWAVELWEQRHIGDFREWKNYAAYQQAFQRLLGDLKAEQG